MNRRYCTLCGVERRISAADKSSIDILSGKERYNWRECYPFAFEKASQIKGFRTPS